MQNSDFMPAVALFLSQHTLVRCEQQDYVYDAGLYYVQDGEWLESEVQKFLDVYGYSFNAANEAAMVRMVRNSAYQAGGVQPPFYLGTRQRADVIVMRNGVLTIAGDGSVCLNPHDPDLFAVCGVPYDYTPTATCPKWEAHVAWMVSGRMDEVRLLRQYCAWAFVAHRLKLEKIMCLYGHTGNNGKSTFLNVVQQVYGESACSAVGLEAFNSAGDFRLWPTLWKIANFSMDAKVEAIRSVAALNCYISSDPITINRKNLSQITLRPTTVLWMASNLKPIWPDSTGAVWRRTLPIECEQSPVEINPKLEDELLAEAPGILNWMLGALPELLQKRAFDIPTSVIDRVAILKSQVNASRQFIAEKLERGTASDFVAADQLRGLFKTWCEINGYRVESIQVMISEMQHMLGSKHSRPSINGVRTRCWPGVKWKPEEQMQAVRFSRDADQGERIRELENRQIILTGQHNEIVNQTAELIDAKTQLEKENQQLRAAQQQRDTAMAALRDELCKAKAGQVWPEERAEMAEQISKQAAVIGRQQSQITAMRTKARILKGKSDKTKPAINAPVPVRNTPEPEPEPVDPAEKAAFDKLMRELEGDDE